MTTTIAKKLTRIAKETVCKRFVRRREIYEKCSERFKVADIKIEATIVSETIFAPMNGGVVGGKNVVIVVLRRRVTILIQKQGLGFIVGLSKGKLIGLLKGNFIF